MRHRALLFLFSSVLCLPALAQTAPISGSAHYNIVQGGKTTKPLGNAQYSVTPVNGGYTVVSSGEMSLAQFKYRFDNSVTVDSQLNLVHDQLNGTVKNVSVAFDAASDSSGREVQIKIDSAGKQTANTVDRHRNTVLIPDLDPAAYMLMVHIAAEKPQTAWALIPKENGLLVPATYLPKAGLSGTLNGAPVQVQHLTAVLGAQNAVTLELYFTADNQLMEADLSLQNFYVIRDGFHLTNRPPPTPPPPGQAPPEAPGAQQQPQQAQPQVLQ